MYVVRATNNPGLSSTAYASQSKLTDWCGPPRSPSSWIVFGFLFFKCTAISFGHMLKYLSGRTVFYSDRWPVCVWHLCGNRVIDLLSCQNKLVICISRCACCIYLSI